MLNTKQTVELIAKAEEMNRELQNHVLRQELSILKKEFNQYNQSKGIQRELQEISCEYYTNELEHTLIMLNK